jgi:uncharacterized membrane protein HdeD (DUF308 family)
MRKADFLIQAVYVLIMLGLLVARSFENETNAFLLIGLLFLGIWQLLSALINTIVAFLRKEHESMKLLRIYWILVISAGIFFGLAITFTRERVFIDPFRLLMNFSGIIALYYLGICYKRAFPGKK